MKARLILPTALTLIVLLPLSLRAAEVLDNAAVVRMVGAGLSADVVLMKIKRSQGAFDTSTDGLIALKTAHVPDSVIAAMLFQGDAVSVPSTAPAVAPETAPVPRAGKDVCAKVKFFTTGNDGMAWTSSSVCVNATSLTVDEQTVALTDVVAHCTSKAPSLMMGGSLLHGVQEWWVGDARETLKFQGKPEDLDQLEAAMTRARSDIPHGGCGERSIRRHLVKP